MPYEYETIKVQQSGGVLTATIDNPPVNVMTLQLFMELATLTTEVESDDNVKVVVFESADPDFFIAHFDVENGLRMICKHLPEVQMLQKSARCKRHSVAAPVKICLGLRLLGGGINQRDSKATLRKRQGQNRPVQATADNRYIRIPGHDLGMSRLAGIVHALWCRYRPAQQ